MTTDVSAVSRADSTRARLLAAAASAFADKGFHATTTRDIASAAGMSPAALYVHHKSKEELLYLIALTEHRRTLSALRQLIDSTDDPVEQLHRAVHDFAVGQVRNRAIARIISYELAALSAEHGSEIQTLRQQTDAEVRGIVKRGVAAGVFEASDPAIATTALMSLGLDTARWHRDEARWTPEYVGERYAELALRMLGAVRRHGA